MMASGCDKAIDPPQPNLSRTMSPMSESAPMPGVKAPELPAPGAPTGAEAATPVPGQAGDQSSPAFKSGGKDDPHKQRNAAAREELRPGRTGLDDPVQSVPIVRKARLPSRHLRRVRHAPCCRVAPCRRTPSVQSIVR